MGGVFGAGVVCSLFFMYLYIYVGNLGLVAYLLIISASAFLLELIYTIISIRRLNDANMSGVWVLLPLAGSVVVVLMACGLETIGVFWNAILSAVVERTPVKDLSSSFEALWAVMLNTTLINVTFSLFLCFREGRAGHNDYGPPPAPAGLVSMVLSVFFIVCGSALNLCLILLWFTKR
jgi:uncharacterized membrane protein YhaH (DUF805 family)